MLQQDFNQQQVKISLQQDLNYRRNPKTQELKNQQNPQKKQQRPDFETGILCGGGSSSSSSGDGCGSKGNYLKCGLIENEKILHNYNNYEQI